MVAQAVLLMARRSPPVKGGEQSIAFSKIFFVLPLEGGEA